MEHPPSSTDEGCQELASWFGAACMVALGPGQHHITEGTINFTQECCRRLMHRSEQQTE